MQNEIHNNNCIHGSRSARPVMNGFVSDFHDGIVANNLAVHTCKIPVAI